MDASPLPPDAGRFLTGFRILDLSHYIPGPMATLFLADFGATVIKIEPPGGDPMTGLGPRDAEGRPVYYRALNAGKAVRRLDLKTGAGRAAFLDLVRTADVVVEGFRPGVLARLGIGYDVLSAAQPGIVLCSISGYGAGSQAAQKAGHDANYLAQSGLMMRNGREAPAFVDPPLADMAGSLFACIAILAALLGRARTGRGCAIDLGLADTAMPLQLLQVADFGATGRVERAGESYLNGAAAYYNVYACADGRHVVLGAVEPKFWAAFCQAAGRPDWTARQDEALPQTALTADLAAYFGALTSDRVADLFGSADCCLSRVDTLDEALADGHFAGRGLVRRGPDGALQALFPARIDGAALAARPPLTLLP